MSGHPSDHAQTGGACSGGAWCGGPLYKMAFTGIGVGSSHWQGEKQGGGTGWSGDIVGVCADGCVGCARWRGWGGCWTLGDGRHHLQ